MPSKYTPRAHKTAPCDHCGDPVKLTRPSKSGLHFCTRKPDCQAAKQRSLRDVYMKGARADAAREHAEAVDCLLRVLRAAATESRIQCPQCGLIDALPGYQHPDGVGGACRAMYQFNFGPEAMRIVGTLWPNPVHEPPAATLDPSAG